MKRSNLLIFISFLLLSACSSSEPAIIKIESPPENANENPELVKEANEEEEEADEFIEFPLNDETIRVNLNLVPILQQYLQSVSDRQEVIKKMNIERLHNDEDNSIYLLEFSCNNTLCSYLLLDQTKENSGYLVADLASIYQTKLSPNQSKILLHFHRESTLPTPVSNIVIMDIETWQPIKIENETNEIDVLQYNWPILTVDWLNDESIAVTIPDIVEPTRELMTDWQNNLEMTTQIVLKFQEE